MRILITGAGGYIGQCLMHHLPSEWDLVGIDRASSADPRIQQGDVCDIAEQNLSPTSFDVAIHLAANPMRNSLCLLISTATFLGVSAF